MTACTNKARGAVVAALAGALALGAAPAIAVAATPADGDVSLLAVTAWQDAEIYSASNGQGDSVSQDALKTGVEFEQGSRQYLVPTFLTNIEGEEGPVRVDGDWTVTYTAPVNGNRVGNQSTGFEKGGVYYEDAAHTVEAFRIGSSDTTVTLSAEDAQRYFTGTLYDGTGTPIVVKQDTYYVSVSDGENTTPNFKFDIVAPSDDLDGLYVYDASDGDTSDKSFTFDGQGQQVGIADEDGTVFNATAKGYKVFVRDSSGKAVPSNEPIEAGTYTLELLKSGESVKNISFKVAPLDLSTATLSVSDFTNGPTGGNLATRNDQVLNKLYINGELLNSDLEQCLSASVSGPNGIAYFDDTKGVYTLTLKSGRSNDTSILNTGTVSFAVLDYDVASTGSQIMYGDTKIDGTPKSLDINLFEGESFDASRVSLVGNDGETYSGDDDLEVTVDGDPTKQGSHTVTVRVKPRQVNGEWVGGSTTFQLDVKGASIDADERLYFYLNGKLAGNSATVTYDGHDWLEDLEVVVRNAAGEEIDASAYDVTVTKGGKEVESATDAGTYQVKVTGKTFTLSNVDTLTLTVSPLSVDKVEVVADIKTDTTSYLRYTGEEITPSYTFFDYVDGEYVEVEVPAEAYDVTYAKGGKRDVEVKEVGTYFASFQTAVDVTNYVVDESCVFEVTKNSVFADVPSDAFYAQSVYDAVEQGYIGGIGGTNLFAPMNQLTRADMACVLYRMAGGSIKASQEDLTDENVATISQFSDVDPHAYYAKAVAWCVEMGVANGYGDTFGSARSISTEEFVTMLARYAAKMGTDTTVDTDAVLAGVADGDQVSGYARDAVAWAVENGYIAKGGNLIAPQESVARWRAVMIAVDYQPEQLDIISDNPNATKPGTGEDASK